jgi:phosphohistidine phosphatase SixA
MKKTIRSSAGIAGGLLFGLVAADSGFADDGKRSDDQLIRDVQGGGYVVYIRHAQTEKDYADQITAEMGDCSTQRTLSEAGWREARAIGAAFTVHQIPVGKVISSEYCRAWQTADLAFGRHVKSPALNFEPAEEYSDTQIAAMRDRTRPYLATLPETGFNTVIVGHDDPFEAATGIYPQPMGVAFVVRPDGQGGFEIVGNIAPNAWF